MPKTTDIVPADDKRTAAVQKEIAPIIEEAGSFKIKTADDMKKATEMLSLLNKRLDEITEEKETITKPANEILKRERARWKPIETLLDSAVSSVRAQMTAWQTKQRAIEQGKKDKLAAQMNEGTLDMDQASNKIAKIKTVDDNVSTEEGSVGFRTDKRFEVMDVLLLAEYERGAAILPNETLIRKLMNKGVELPGVRYYTEETPVNRR